TSLPFYKRLLQAVNVRHAELRICSALVMRFAAKIEQVVQAEGIDAYLDVCVRIIAAYGVNIAEQYIRHSHELAERVALADVVEFLQGLSEKSLVHVEFAVTFPRLLLAAPTAGLDLAAVATSPSAVRAAKVAILRDEDFATFRNNGFLFADKDFLAL